MAGRIRNIKKVVLSQTWEVFEYDVVGRHRLPNI
jgi:hypothetical protein